MRISVGRSGVVMPVAARWTGDIRDISRRCRMFYQDKSGIFG